MADLCELAIGLWAPNLPASGAKSPIVSGGYLKYSRFWKTATGDWVRSGLRGGRGSAISGIYWNMADGQVVLVTTEPSGGGSPVRSVFFVAEQDPEKAKAIIGAMMAPNEKVEAWGQLPEAAVKALGLKPGDFKHG
jgi:hypothetical protein